MQLHLVRIGCRWIFQATPTGRQIGLRWRWWVATERESSKDQGVLGVPVHQPEPPHELVVQGVVDQVKNSIHQQICLFLLKGILKTEIYPLQGVELRGGSGPQEGNIWVDGEPVCDDTFTESSHGEVNAQVICRCGA